jgi:hypothetical protein
MPRNNNNDDESVVSHFPKLELRKCISPDSQIRGVEQKMEMDSYLRGLGESAGWVPDSFSRKRTSLS